MISVGDDEQAHASIGKLISALDEQEERAKNAKEIKPTKPAATTTASSDVKKSTKGRHVGASTMPDSEVLTDPDRALARQEQEAGRSVSVQELKVSIERIITVLTQNNRAAEAQKFTQKLNGH
jgi:hypothetical protein